MLTKEAPLSMVQLWVCTVGRHYGVIEAAVGCEGRKESLSTGRKGRCALWEKGKAHADVWRWATDLHRSNVAAAGCGGGGCWRRWDAAYGEVGWPVPLDNSLSKWLPSPYHVLGNVQGTQETAANKAERVPILAEITLVQVKKKTGKKTNEDIVEEQEV